MAKKPCVKCPKGPGQVICDGCRQCFCGKHLNEHRQELDQQMDALTLEHDQLQQHIAGEIDDQQHPVIARVSRWESKCIEKIKEVANDVRLRLKHSLHQVKRNIQESLPQMVLELTESREAETYNEPDLSRWADQLKELREQLDKLPMVQLIDDKEDGASSTYIPLIRLRVLQRMRGKQEWRYCFVRHAKK